MSLEGAVKGTVAFGATSSRHARDTDSWQEDHSEEVDGKWKELWQSAEGLRSYDT